MTVVSNNQSFYATASGSTIQGLANQFRNGMDTVLLGMGRNITLHLEPSKQRCPSGSCRFNDTYKKFIGSNGQVCRTCGGDGYLIEPRQTVYIANIRWIDKDLLNAKTGGDGTPAGRVYDADVRVKTVAASFEDIKNCIGATIDGIPVKLKTDPRQTGFGGQVFYVISYWERTGKTT